MKLTRLVLENFRSFEHAELDFLGEDGKPLGAVVLVGPNGAGKSSVLAAIVGLLTCLHSPYRGPRSDERDIMRGRDRARVGLSWVDGPFSSALDSSLHILLPRSEGSSAAGSNVYAAVPEGGWIEELEVPHGSVGLVVGFDAYRIVPSTPPAGPNIQHVPVHRLDGSISSTVTADGTIRPRFAQLTQWIVNLDFRRAKAKADRGEDYPAWELMRRGLDRLLAPFRFAGVDDDNNVLFETPTGTVSLASMSDGLRSMFVIVTELMMRLSMAAEDQSRMLEGEAVCLIDEIDAHLHPNWQQNVLPGLRIMFPNVQFIVTTHSPLVVASAIAEEVFYIGPEEDEL